MLIRPRIFLQPSAPLIEVRGLRYAYPGAADEALRGLDFEVGAGEIFGFLGPSGAGKSTTQSVLTGLLHGWTGEVRVFGAPPAAHGRGFYDRIGVSFEVPNVYARLTGRENLEFFASLHGRRATAPERLLTLVGLGAAADRRVAAYSRGMRMRLNFCRALLHDPELLFLDEPTGGQDPENARRIKEIVRARRAAGATVLLTTHDMTLATELCDRVAFIVDGRIAALDTPRAFMVAHGKRTLRVAYRRGGVLATAEFELDGLAENAAFLALIREERLETMHTLDATLEDVFVAVTGRRLA